MRYTDLKYCLNNDEMFLLSQMDVNNRAAALRLIHDLKKRTDDKDMIDILRLMAEKIWYMPESVFKRVIKDLKEGGNEI